MSEPLEGSSLTPFSFPGTYADTGGVENIEWHVLPTRRRSPWQGPGYEFRTRIRGVECSSYDFDGIGPDDVDAAVAVWLDVDLQHGDLTEYVVTGDLPLTVEIHGEAAQAVVAFELDTRHGSRSTCLRLRFQSHGLHGEVIDEWFEDGLRKLEGELAPGGVALRCCVTCLYSDYSPGGHGLMGMSCHRGAKEQYLAVEFKADYWPVPVTEDVMETHLCPEYERRIPGTGYRG